MDFERIPILLNSLPLTFSIEGFVPARKIKNIDEWKFFV